jgi:hypothetical protein
LRLRSIQDGRVICGERPAPVLHIRRAGGVAGTLPPTETFSGIDIQRISIGLMERSFLREREDSEQYHKCEKYDGNDFYDLSKAFHRVSKPDG